MVGHPAHGGALRESAIPSGQRQLQFLGNQQGIVKEHLIKIPQAEEEDVVFVLLFDLLILLHHGR